MFFEDSEAVVELLVKKSFSFDFLAGWNMQALRG